MATSGSDQPNDENSQPGKNGSTPAVAAGVEPPKTAKQLQKEAEKAEKLRKLEEKLKAIALVEERVWIDHLQLQF